jgi:hypothetical protein
MTTAAVLVGLLCVPMAVLCWLVLAKPPAPHIDRCRHCHGALDEYDSGTACRWCAEDDAREYAGVDR